MKDAGEFACTLNTPLEEAGQSPRSPNLKSVDTRTETGTFFVMTSIPVTQARAKLYQLVDNAAERHEPVHITGKRASAVLISEEDWRNIQETLHLLSVPGMRESVIAGMKQPLDKCSKTLKW